MVMPRYSAEWWSLNYRRDHYLAQNCRREFSNESGVCAITASMLKLILIYARIFVSNCVVFYSVNQYLKSIPKLTKMQHFFLFIISIYSNNIKYINTYKECLKIMMMIHVFVMLHDFCFLSKVMLYL